MTRLNRRRFLQGTGAVGAGLAAGAALPLGGRAAARQEPGELKKAVVYNMLPRDLTVAERFRLAKSTGFDGVEVPPVDEERAREMRAAADAAGIELHSIIYGGWNALLSSADPQVAERGGREIQAALRQAKIVGADAILLVPARVTASVRYADAYTRSQERIRTLIPLARELEVVIAIENVWNDFLLSPLEFARYVDEFESRYVRAYFDVGNVVATGWPQDWIRTLGERIVKLHLKDFRRRGRQWTPLREGDVDWPEVRRALAEVGFSGYLTAELGAGDEAYLREVAERIDLIIAGR